MNYMDWPDYGLSPNTFSTERMLKLFFISLMGWVKKWINVNRIFMSLMRCVKICLLWSNMGIWIMEIIMVSFHYYLRVM